MNRSLVTISDYISPSWPVHTLRLISDKAHNKRRDKSRVTVLQTVQEIADLVSFLLTLTFNASVRLRPERVCLENLHEPGNFVTFTFGLKLAFLSFTHSLAFRNSIISILRDVSWQLLAVSSPLRLDQVPRLFVMEL